MFVDRLGRNEEILERTWYIDAPCKILVHLGKQFQRRRYFPYQPIRNKNCLWRPCLLTDRDEMRKLYKGPYIDAPCKILIHLAKRFQMRRSFPYQPIRNKNCLWRPCLLTDWDEMRKLYKGPYIDAPCKILIHLAKRFQMRRSFPYQPIRNKNCLWRPCLLTDLDEMRKLYKGPYIDAPCKILIHLAKRFQMRRSFPYQPIRNKNCLWRPCLLTDRDEMRKLYKGPYIDAPCKILIHLAKRFQMRRSFPYQPIRNKNCLWRPCLLTDRDEMRKLYKGPYIDASYQVWFHLAQWFQRRRLKCEKLTDDGRTDGRTDDGRDGRQVMTKAHMAF